MAETGFKKWIITITVITASLLELIDTTIVNVSLPQIQGNLGATLEDVAWVTTGYAVANVIILPMSGWLGNVFGRKNYFLGSIILFTIASFLCGNSHSLGELVMFRILQGVAGGGLISTAQAILIETWPRDQIGTATALFGLGAVVGPTVGPTIGGYITDHATWQWIFYVNIPVGAIAAFCTLTFVNKTPKQAKGIPVDWWGIALLAIAVGSLQVILEKGESEDWFSKTYILVLTVTAILGYHYVYLARNDLRVPHRQLWYITASKFRGRDVYVVYIGFWAIRVSVCVPDILSKPFGLLRPANRRTVVPRGAMHYCNDAVYR